MKLKSVNPSNEEVIGEFEVSDSAAVAKKVKSARLALKDWRKSGISSREQIVKRFSSILRERSGEVAELISKEMGKPIKEAQSEVEGTFAYIDWFLSNVGKIMGQEDLDVGDKLVKAKVLFEPAGVVGIITPWNFPIDTPLWKIIPALLAGNTVVFKPSELSTFCGLKLLEMFKEAKIPEGVFDIVTGDAATGRRLVMSRVDMISFTGSSGVGKEVAGRSGRGLKKVVLELGGSDPFIVFADADFERAVNAAVYGRFLNCGQVCTAAKRILIDARIYEKFVKSFVDKVKMFRVGRPSNRNTEIGPLASRKQLEVLERQVKDAVKKGAHVLCGGKRTSEKGYFYEPTVLTDVNGNMQVMKEEVFGPVACLLSFKTARSAIRIANNTRYGLGASVWTQNEKTAEEMTGSIDSGMVWVNDFGTAYPQCPQGGVKQSGMGRELSSYGVLEFCRMKTVVASSDNEAKKSWWFPYC